MKPETIFRANVGIVVRNRDGLVLAFERRDVPGAWQLPQGGIDGGEEPEDAVYRELEEETGLGRDSVALVGRHPGWLTYELPPRLRTQRTGRGQAQAWYLVEVKDGAWPGGFQGTAEFSNWKWTRLRDLAGEVIEFRRSVYAALADHFAAQLAD